MLTHLPTPSWLRLGLTLALVALPAWPQRARASSSRSTTRSTTSRPAPSARPSSVPKPTPPRAAPAPSAAPKAVPAPSGQPPKATKPQTTTRTQTTTRSATRRPLGATSRTLYVGDLAGKVYHLRTCPVGPGRGIGGKPLASSEAARRAGYKPCPTCKPK